MKFKILGVEYQVKYIQQPTTYMKKNNFTAVADYNRQQILIANNYFGEIERYEAVPKKTEETKRQDLLHELAHVFLYETGQDDINDERIVEVMAKFVSFVEKEINTKVGE